MRKIAVLLLACFLSACVTYQQSRLPRMDFPVHEYQRLTTSGTAIVNGQAFMKTRGGDVKLAAGNEVFLNPVTSYSTEWYEKSYLPNIGMVRADSRILNYVTTTVADGEGRFTFKNVPAGEYFVTSNVNWEAATGYQGALRQQGGVVTKRITVKDGEELDIVVTR